MEENETEEQPVEITCSGGVTINMGAGHSLRPYPDEEDQ